MSDNKYIPTPNIVINNHVNSHNSNETRPESSPPDEDKRKSWLGIALPVLLASVLGLVPFFCNFNKQAPVTCNIEHQIDCTIYLLELKLAKPIADKDEHLILVSYKKQFQNYLDMENICQQLILHPSIQQELEKCHMIIDSP